MNYINDIIGSMLFLFIFFIFVKRKAKGNFKEYGFVISNFKSIISSFFIAVILVSINTFISKKIAGEKHYLNEYSFLIKFFVYWLLIPISEEIFFRGMLQTLLAKKIKKTFRFFKLNLSFSIILTAIIFGLSHGTLFFYTFSVFKTILVIIFTTILGLFLGYFREKEKSLYPSIVMHISYNSVGGIISILFF